MAAESEQAAQGSRLQVPLPPKGIKAVIWDWDKTVLRIHSWAQRVRAEDVRAGHHEGDFMDREFFEALVKALVEREVKVLVASFGSYEVIQAYTDRLFGHGSNPFNRDTISTPSTLGTFRGEDGQEHAHKDGTSVRGQKLPQLKKLCDAHALKKHEVMFFDDDIKNIVGEYGALSDDYVNSFYCPEAFTRSVWETALRRMEEGDPTYMTQWKAAQQGSSPAGHHASQ